MNISLDNQNQLIKIQYIFLIKSEMRTEIFDSNNSILGRGALGQVIKVKQGDRWYAVKKISKKLIQNSGRLKQLKREVEVMKKINHENVVKIQGFMETNADYMIKMQFCEGENLKQFLLSNSYAKLMNSDKPNYYTVQISLDLINALAMVRSMLISNRDIKPQNIIINKSPNGKISAKMIDFGQARFHIGYATSHVGTFGYMAPEVYQKGSYTEACDDWSLGCVLYQLFNHPFQKNGSIKQLICPFKENFEYNFQKLYTQYIQEPLSLEKLRNPDPIRSIIRNLLRVLPDQRYKLQKVLQILINEFKKISIFLPQSDRNHQILKLQDSLIQLKNSKLKRQNIRVEIQTLKISYKKIITVIMRRVSYEQIISNIQFVKFFIRVYKRINLAVLLISKDLQVDSQYIKEQIINEFITKIQQEQTETLFNRINNYLIRNKIILPENLTFGKTEVKKFLISKKFADDQIGIILANLCVITFQDQ